MVLLHRAELTAQLLLLLHHTAQLLLQLLTHGRMVVLHTYVRLHHVSSMHTQPARSGRWSHRGMIHGQNLWKHLHMYVCTHVCLYSLFMLPTEQWYPHYHGNQLRTSKMHTAAVTNYVYIVPLHMYTYEHTYTSVLLLTRSWPIYSVNYRNKLRITIVVEAHSCAELTLIAT